MWYFNWILGIGLACAFAVVNALWFELAADKVTGKPSDRA